MLSRNRLIGAMLLGQKRSGALFVHEDLELLGPSPTRRPSR
jgi:hypothetical protein